MLTTTLLNGFCFLKHDENFVYQQRELQNNFSCLYPVNPHMRNEDSRFETFDHRWPQNRVRATPRQIAKAGFFFLGERDRVKCWYCNGGLDFPAPPNTLAADLLPRFQRLEETYNLWSYERQGRTAHHFTFKKTQQTLGTYLRDNRLFNTFMRILTREKCRFSSSSPS